MIDSPQSTKPWKTLCFWSSGITVALIIAITGLFFYLNRLQPLTFDDYMYCFVFGTKDVPISLGGLYESLQNHWLYGHGRCFMVATVQLFLMCDKIVFDIANTLALLVLTVAVVRFTSENTRSCKWFSCALVLALFVLLTPDQGCTMINLCAALNTLWMYLYLILFLFLAVSSDVRKLTLALLLAAIVGNLHEGLSIGMMVFLFFYTIIGWKKLSNERYFLCAMIVLMVLGFAFNLFAPGTRIRMASMGAHEGGLIAIISSFFEAAMYALTSSVAYKFTLPSIILWVLAGLVLICRRSSGWDRKNTVAACFLMAALVQAAAVCSGGMSVMYERSWSGVLFYALLAFLVYFIPLFQTLALYWKGGLSLACAGTALVILLLAIPGAQAFRAYDDSILAQLKSGKPYAVAEFPRVKHVPMRFWLETAITANSTFYSNLYAARYHGVKSACAISAAQDATLRGIAPEKLCMAREGSMLMLDNGAIFLMLDATAYKVSTCTCTVASDEPHGAPIALNPWFGVVVMDDKIGLLVEPGPKVTSLEIRLMTADWHSCQIIVSESMVEQLRKEGSLPASQVQITKP